LNIVVYLFSLHFALCSREEHHRLHHERFQISLKTTGDGRRYLEYCEEPEINKEG